MTPCSPPKRTVSFTCPVCRDYETFDAVHMTLTLDGDYWVLLAKCATEGVTTSAQVADNLVPQMLLLPLLLDPEVREHITRKATL